MVRDSASQLGKGFGFVQFSDQQAARAALGCDGQLLRKRPIRVTKAVKVPAHLKALGRQEKPGRKPMSKDAADGKRSATAGIHAGLMCFDTLAVLICRQSTQNRSALLLRIFCYSIADVCDQECEWHIHMLDSCSSQTMHHIAWAFACADTCKGMYSARYSPDILSVTLQPQKRADLATRQLLPCNAKQSQLKTGRVSRQRGPKRPWLVLSPRAPQLGSDLWRAKGKQRRRGLL